ncbi:MAG: nucleoside-diphosphate sugar epimerase [Mucilaginibacter sp.]|jgi:uncharacterized protein YbjT (DUF2867 family)|nr:nucleoside-diphosphate sugar epimerase [Mucilaginibacter sp.]
MAIKAIIAGASGLIGSKLLDILLQQPEYDEILILVRKELSIKHKKLTQLIVDFDTLDNYSKAITGHAVFCCLGSTRKKTPDLNDYRKVDHDYPLQLAQIAYKNGISQYHLVSAIGADAASSNFYTKMKGEVEEDIKKIGLSGLYIYQPSFLTGERKENRLVERIFIPIMKVINPLLIGNLKKYRSIPAVTVAMAMYKQSLKNEEGVFIYPSDKIKQLL